MPIFKNMENKRIKRRNKQLQEKYKMDRAKAKRDKYQQKKSNIFTYKVKYRNNINK